MSSQRGICWGSLVLVVALHAALPTTLPAALPAPLSLDAAVDLALTQHRDARLAMLSLRRARLDRLASRLRLAPRVDLLLNLPSVVDSRNETWTQQGDSLRLVWVDWNQRRESGTLRLGQDLPFGTRVELDADLWHRRSDTGSFTEERGGAWSAHLRQSLLPRQTLWGDLAQSEREADQAELEALEELADLRHRVGQAWLSLLLQQEGLVLARQDLEQAVASRQRAANRLAAGLIAESDYLKVELDELRQRASFQSDSLESGRSARSFLRLVGLPEGPLPTLDNRIPDLPPLPALDSLRIWLLQEHADIRAQALNHWKAGRELRRQQWARLPEVELDAAWTWREEGEAWLWMPEEPRLDRSLSLTLAWPLFAAGAGGRAVAGARMALDHTTLQGEALAEDLEDRLEQLWLQAEAQRLEQPLLDRQLELAGQDAEISRQRFQAGQITSSDLIEAEGALSRLRLESLRTSLERWRTRLVLERLVGVDRRQLEERLGAVEFQP